MNSRSILAGLDLHAIQQVVKWIVYAILLINFVGYLIDDLQFAEYGLQDGESFLRWTTTFAATLDELAWFMLLFLFELETYALSDEAFEGVTGKLVHGVRILCYVFILHTIYAYYGDVLVYSAAAPLAGISSLCQLTGQEISYTYNLVYTVLDQTNCSTLSADTMFYPADSETLVTDSRGIAVLRGLAWADVIEASIWLLIVVLIEYMVRLQGRGVTSGPTITIGNYAKLALYGFLFVIAGYWATLQHWLFVWDEFIWIAGFAAIEMNVVEWRGEMEQEAPAPHSA